MDDRADPAFGWRNVKLEVIENIFDSKLSVCRVRSRDERSVNMKTPPESFLLFKEELRKAQLEKDRLKQHYEEKLAEVNQELCRLKEQIQSQQDMMRTTLEYASNLEARLTQVREDVALATRKNRDSIY